MNVYIHIPFCKQKCQYCNVVSFTKINETRVKKYFEALKNEILSRLHTNITTIYIGGGSPSLVPVIIWSDFFKFLNRNYSLKNIEISIELNPSEINYSYLQNLKSFGINRISFGIQTLDIDILNKLNRFNASNIIQVFEFIFKIFSNVNIDLIFGLPFSNYKIFKNDLKVLLNFPFTHLSIYDYENYNDLNNLPNEKDLISMEYYKNRLLKIKGFTKYEISNYAKNEKYSLHNIDFWNGKDYLGFGLSAVSQIDNIVRENTEELSTYILDLKYNEYQMTKIEHIENYISRRLRIIGGFNINDFKKKFGFEFSLSKDIDYLKINDKIIVEEEGLKILNQIIKKIILHLTI
jgi:oxygen-independent coproporphyrinogen III oxidase